VARPSLFHTQPNTGGCIVVRPGQSSIPQDTATARPLHCRTDNTNHNHHLAVARNSSVAGRHKDVLALSHSQLRRDTNNFAGQYQTSVHPDKIGWTAIRHRCTRCIGSKIHLAGMCCLHFPHTDCPTLTRSRVSLQERVLKYWIFSNSRKLFSKC
jgi:hypothetical protein